MPRSERKRKRKGNVTDAKGGGKIAPTNGSGRGHGLRHHTLTTSRETTHLIGAKTYYAHSPDLDWKDYMSWL